MIHEIENDIMQEVINIGVGEAASVLSELVNSRVTIRIPEIRVCNIAGNGSNLTDNHWRYL